MKKIVIVGLGALGSHVMLFLRNIEADFVLFDFDRTEIKNTKSQFHNKMNIGKNKALSLKRTLQGLFGIKVAASTAMIQKNNIEMLVGSADLLIDCTDNIKTRTLLKTYCQQEAIPCLHGGLSTDGNFGAVLWTEDFIPDPESGDGATCEDGEHLPFFGLVANQLALTAQRFINTGEKCGYHISTKGINRVT